MVTKNHKVHKIHSQAPTRIDLAGGTVDIWPIYLFLQKPTTLNLAIDLYAEADLEILSASGGGQVILQSSDQKGEIHFPWSALENDADEIVPPNLILHYKLLKYFYLQRKKKDSSSYNCNYNYNLKLSTRARSPAGAGLGGSSALSIALIGALATWARAQAGAWGAESEGREDQDGSSIMGLDPREEGESFIEIVRDIETTVIQIPAGLQDYYAAMYGGLQSLRWGTGKHERSELPAELIPELESRILLFYSGQSRNSGINNWAMFKAFIDKQGDIPRRFEMISSATRELESALLAKDWNKAGAAIAQEWATRKTLAAGITLPEIDQAFAEAQKLTPLSGKVCGAGGGGCFFVYLPLKKSDEGKELKDQIQSIFVKHGMKPLKFRCSPHGLEVRTNSSSFE